MALQVLVEVNDTVILQAAVTSVTALAMLLSDLLTCKIELRVQARWTEHAALLALFSLQQTAELYRLRGVGGDGRRVALVPAGADHVGVVACRGDSSPAGVGADGL